MADRQDIDALLIGALYGELDGDERARLEAHLASHPQDRSALDGLRSTRALLREADLPVAMAVEEPSPAITAMLLQDAARRAPAPASRGGFLAFLASLLKPFAASPALSAAAALVLVGGAAGLLYSRGAFRTVEPTVDNSRTAQVDKLDKGEMTAAAAPSGAAPGSAATLTPTTPNVDDYRVGLVDGENAVATGTAGADRGPAPDVANEREALAKNADVAGIVAGDSLAAKGKRSAGSGGGGGTAPGAGSGAAFQDSATGTAKLDSATRPGYITIDEQSKDEPTVLALDGARYESAPAGEADEDQAPADKSVAKKAPARVALAEGRGATAPTTDAPAPSSAPPPPAAGSPQKPIAGKAPGSGTQQQVARDQGQGKTGSKAYDPVKAAQLDGWARDQHAKMVKLVNAGKCTDAGTVGAEIARKNPDYYQANVANDRAVRACRSYVDRARRAKAEDSKTKAAAPRNNAPDSPYQADMETQSK
jgi:hypothetical protein